MVLHFCKDYARSSSEILEYIGIFNNSRQGLALIAAYGAFAVYRRGQKVESLKVESLCKEAIRALRQAQ